jgi:signal transduction histidine kinase
MTSTGSSFDQAVHGALARDPRLPRVDRAALAHIGRVSAMAELTASLAHGLNQPLTAILNNAEVALRHLDAAPPSSGCARSCPTSSLTTSARRR